MVLFYAVSGQMRRDRTRFGHWDTQKRHDKENSGSVPDVQKTIVHTVDNDDNIGHLSEWQRVDPVAYRNKDTKGDFLPSAFCD